MIQQLVSFCSITPSQSSAVNTDSSWFILCNEFKFKFICIATPRTKTSRRAEQALMATFELRIMTCLEHAQLPLSAAVTASAFSCWFVYPSYPSRLPLFLPDLLGVNRFAFSPIKPLVSLLALRSSCSSQSRRQGRRLREEPKESWGVIRLPSFEGFAYIFILARISIRFHAFDPNPDFDLNPVLDPETTTGADPALSPSLPRPSKLDTCPHQGSAG